MGARSRFGGSSRGIGIGRPRRAVAVALLGGGLLPGLIVALASPAWATAEVFTATLTGGQEVPPSGSPAIGAGRVYLNFAENEIRVDLSWAGLGSAAIDSHIHGPADTTTEAGVLFPLGAGTGGTTGAVGTATFAITAAQVAELRAGLYYFNVHSTLIPGGEIRGQIGRAALPTEQLFIATLRGSQEVPANASTGTGFGSVYLNAAQTQIIVDLRWSGLTTETLPGGAHIHGPATVAVEAGIPFALSGVPTATTGAIPTQVFAVTAAQVAELKSGQLYFNVHTTTFPGGEVRGQITPAHSLPAVVRTSTDWRLRDAQTTGSETNTFSFGDGQRPLTPLTGDWDGNGSKTPAYYKNGVVNIKSTHAGGPPESTISFASDPRGFPVAGDFDGNGVDDVAVFRAGLWQVRLSTGAVSSFTFGTGSWPATIPVVGDWDGDGVDGIGTYSMATATWGLRNSANAGAADAGSFAFGTANASYPVVGDWNGDGIDNVGVKSTAGGTWSLRNANGAGPPDLTFNYGVASDLPLAWR